MKFSLRTALWLMLLVAAFFAGQATMVPKMQRIQAEADAAREEAEARRVVAEVQAERSRAILESMSNRLLRAEKDLATD